MKFTRRQFLPLAACGAALPVLLRAVGAETFPTRPPRIIVGYPAGQGPDLVARLLGQRLTERFGQQFVVENRPGAGGNIAAEIAVRASPDGYTLLVATATNAINATLYDKLNFDFIRDLAPVASLGRVPVVMVANPAFPTKTVPDFIAYAKANAGKINFASSGIGSLPHIAGELFKMLTSVNMVHVPYRSNYMPDLLGGQVQVAFTTIASAIEYIRTGKLRALAVGSATRSDSLPDVPVIGDFVSGYEASGWDGICVVKNSPPEIIEKLNSEINAVIGRADMKTRLLDLGFEPMLMTPGEFGKFLADDTQRWSRVIKFANIKPE